VLPIVQRELLVASRKSSVATTRFVAAGIGVAVVAMAVVFHGAVGVGSGAGIFHTPIWIAFWSCFFGGTLLTADCLAVERRNDTLGLLFLTTLKGYDVVLGELVAKSLTGLFCLVAVVPVLAIPMLLGGITAGEFWRSVLVLLNTLPLSLSAGMLESVFSKEARGVVALALLIMVLIACGPIALISVGNFRQRADGIFFQLFPPAALMLATSNTFATEAVRYFTNLAVTLVLSLLMLATASFWITRSWHTRTARGIGLRWQHFKRRVTQGSPAYRAQLRPRLLNINPVLWLHSRDRSLRVSLTVFFLVLAGGCYWMNFSRAFHWTHIPSALACFVFLYLLFLALVAFESACYLIERRNDGAMELLLSTELGTGDILRGHWLAARRLFSGALTVMIVYATGWLGAAVFHALPANRVFALVFPFLVIASLVTSGNALVWCTMSYSFRAKWPSLPAMRGFAMVVVLPFVWFGILAVLLSDQHASALVWWTVIAASTILNSQALSGMAQKRLHNNLRRVLTEPLLGKTRGSEA